MTIRYRGPSQWRRPVSAARLGGVSGRRRSGSGGLHWVGWLLVAVFGGSMAGPARALAPLAWSSPATVFHDRSGQGDVVAALSCPTASFCASADLLGALASSERPASGSGAWHETSLGVSRVLDLSCASASLCLAVNGQANVLVSSRPAVASAWRSTALPAPPGPDGTPPAASGVSCSSPSFCMVVGSNSGCASPPLHGCGPYQGFVASSANPTGPSSGWLISTTPQTLEGVRCGPRARCVGWDGGGGLDTPTGGGTASWRTVGSYESGVGSVSCPSATLCVAADYAGHIYVSRAPTVPGSWTSDRIDTVAINGVSCASVRFCVAVDAAGNVLSSTAPTRGPGAWTQANVDSNGISGVSCPTTRFCAAIDLAGRRLVASAPTGAAIRALLRSALGAPRGTATIKQLRSTRAFTFQFTAPVTGTLAISWYAMTRPGRRATTPIAKGRLALTSSYSGPVRLVLTRAGVRLLGHTRGVVVTARGTFTPTNGRALTETRQLTLH